MHRSHRVDEKKLFEAVEEIVEILARQVALETLHPDPVPANDNDPIVIPSQVEG